MEAILIPVSAEKSISLPHQQMKTSKTNSPTFKTHNSHRNYQHRQPQPPLLPLPRRSLPPPSPPSRISSCQKTNKSPKKSNSTKRNRDSEDQKKKSANETVGEIMIVDSTNRLGPEPSHLPKFCVRSLEKEMEFSGSVFSLSPPPSSVPLPKFSSRPKLISCNMEAAAAAAASVGIDAGATDNLRRLLRLR